MAVFRATKAYHFSQDGTDETTWAKFNKVPASDPPIFEAEVTKTSDVAALRKLIKDKVPGFTDITEIEPVKASTDTSKKAPAKKAGSKAAKPGDAGDGDKGDDGDQGDGDQGDGSGDGDSDGDGDGDQGDGSDADNTGAAGEDQNGA